METNNLNASKFNQKLIELEKMKIEGISAVNQKLPTSLQVPESGTLDDVIQAISNIKIEGILAPDISAEDGTLEYPETDETNVVNGILVLD